MATPGSTPRNFEFIVRRTFWLPMVKIILWNVSSYALNIGLLLFNKWGVWSLAEWRLHLFFHLFSLVGTVWILLNWNSIKYTITNTKIVVEHGILNIDRDTFLFRNIECLKLRKNVLGMICGFGTIEMYAPTLQEHVFLRNVGRAKKYAILIQKSIAAQRSNGIVYPSASQQKTSLLDQKRMEKAI